jgi:hypothetical protein
MPVITHVLLVIPLMRLIAIHVGQTWDYLICGKHFINRFPMDIATNNVQQGTLLMEMEIMNALHVIHHVLLVP